MTEGTGLESSAGLGSPNLNLVSTYETGYERAVAYLAPSMRMMQVCQGDELEGRIRRTVEVSILYINDNQSERTLQAFLHPPPLSSMPFGGFHFHVQSNDTEGLPLVE